MSLQDQDVRSSRAKAFHAYRRTAVFIPDVRLCAECNVRLQCFGNGSGVTAICVSDTESWGLNTHNRDVHNETVSLAVKLTISHCAVYRTV